jgi:hypothetical protein
MPPWKYVFFFMCFVLYTESHTGASGKTASVRRAKAHFFLSISLVLPVYLFLFFSSNEKLFYPKNQTV